MVDEALTPIAFGFRLAVLADWTAVHPAGGTVAGVAGDGVIQHPQRTATDGGIELQPAVPLVRGAGSR